MGSLKKVIQFYPTFKDKAEFSSAPSPGVVSNIPLWFRKLPKYLENETRFVYDLEPNFTVRNCIPFLEGFTSGYVMTLPCDIQVRKLPDGQTRFTWGASVPVTPVTERAKHIGHLPDIDGYEPLGFNWMPDWSVITPPGYSCQFIHPINRIDLPFYTLGGIVDTDKWGEAGNHPFYLKKGFEGILPKGTPFVQIIPFKRDNWKSQINDDMNGRYLKKVQERDSVLIGWYKKFAWGNKSYR